MFTIEIQKLISIFKECHIMFFFWFKESKKRQNTLESGYKEIFGFILHSNEYITRNMRHISTIIKTEKRKRER